MNPKVAATSGRRTQERTEVTRNKLLDAAALLFTENGYEGVSIRDLENEAGVQRGLLLYHFGDKQTLWKKMADRTFKLMIDAQAPRLEILRDLPARERVSAIVRFYVRFSSMHPELPRLLSQEARHHSWRLSYLVEEHIADTAATLRKPVIEALGLSEQKFMHWYYLMVGASSLIFSHAPECELLFGVDPHDDDVVEAHAQMMVSALLGQCRGGVMFTGVLSAALTAPLFRSMMRDVPAWRLLEDFVRPDLRPGLYAYWQRLQARHGYRGICGYPLAAVARGTGRIRELKQQDAAFQAAFHFTG